MLRLAAGGLSSAQIGRRLDLARHTVDDYFSSVLQRCRAHSRSEAVARAYALGIFVPGEWPPRWSSCTCLASDSDSDSDRSPARLETDAKILVNRLEYGDLANVSMRSCRTVIDLHLGYAVVVPESDRIAGVMKELMKLLEVELGPRPANSDAIPGTCIAVQLLNGGNSADETLILAAVPKDPRADGPFEARPTAGEVGGPAPGNVGRPRALAAAALATAAERRAQGESVTAIARDLRIGRSTLYRALRSRRASHPAPRGVTAALSSDA